MKLNYDFPRKVRLLYLYQNACFLCGANGWGRGGLEIHHILGRTSSSAFNSSCLCGTCHAHIGHTREEHQTIFLHTLRFLKDSDYQPSEEDWSFLQKYSEDLINGNQGILDWLNTKT